MNKSYLMKSMALTVMAVTAVSCNHDAWNERPDNTKQEALEYETNFKSLVLGGQNVDANQTWNTATTTQTTVKVNLTAGESYNVYIFTSNPETEADAAYIAKTTVIGGQEKTVTMSRPSDKSTLFASAYLNGKRVKTVAFSATASSVVVGNTSASAPARRAAAEFGWELSTDFAATFSKQYYTDVLTYLPEEISAGEQLTNYEFLSKGPFQFSIIYSQTSAADKVGYYYYNPANQTINDRTEVVFVQNIQNEFNSLVQFTNDGNSYYNGGATSGAQIFNSWGAIGSKAKVFTVNVPSGYRVGFFTINGEHEMYSNSALNNVNADTGNNYYYSAVVTKGSESYLVGLEDWYYAYGNDHVADCNDIIMAINQKTSTPPVVVTPTDDDEEGLDPSWCYFAFEDLGATDDFDFNDVVVRVSTPDENGTATVELCAIGGTLESTVFNGTTQIGSEVHAYGSFGDNTKKVVETLPTQIGTVNVPANTAVADLNINIRVKRADGNLVTVTKPAQGETPFCITVTGDENGKWYWAQERVSISTAYPLFGAWGANINTNPDWYKSPVEGKVVKW